MDGLRIMLGLGLLGVAVAADVAEPAASRREGPLDADPHVSSASTVLDPHARAAHLRLAFVANPGGLDPRVLYYARGPGLGADFTSDGVWLSLLSPLPAREDDDIRLPTARPSQRITLALRFAQANPHPVVTAEGPGAGRVNAIVGDEPSAWRTGLVGYDEIVYRDLWPGIEIRFRSRDGKLEYEIVVEPGARSEDVRLTYAGAAGFSPGEDGELLVRTPIGVFRDATPVAYQVRDGRMVPVPSGFAPEAGSAVYGFRVGPGYDPSAPLVIAAGLLYSSYIGDRAEDGTIDEGGSAYVTGWATSPDFPTTPGVVDSVFAGEEEVYVVKLTPDGSAPVYSTLIGGSGGERGLSVAVDSAGNAYIAGITSSADFPTTQAPCPGVGPNDNDVFVLKLNATGSALLYSLCFGGSNNDFAFEAAVDPQGRAYVGGWTRSSDFPTTPGAYDNSFNGGFSDTFVAKVDAAGTAVVYSTLLGGDGDDRGRNIAVSRLGEATLVGSTGSPAFPTTPGAFDRQCGTDGACDPDPLGELREDAFVTRLNTTGSALVYSTFLGGGRLEKAWGVALDAGGSAYVTGVTASEDFPAGGPGCVSPAGQNDAFVSRLDPEGAALVHSRCLGGASVDLGYDIRLAPRGRVLVTGWTKATDFPVTPDAFDGTANGDFDAFAAELDADGLSILYATYLGGSLEDRGKGIGFDGEGNLYLIGDTASPDFPTTPGAYDTTINEELDAFATKLPFCGGRPATSVGTASADALSGTAGADVIQGLDGKDTIDGLAGVDLLCGGRGDDRLLGRDGADLLLGGGGADLLTAGGGDDVLEGERGNDTLRGNAGDDLMDGGAGNDACDGGSQSTADAAVACEAVTGVP